MGLAYIDNAVDLASSKAGLPPDMVRVALCLALSFPLCAIVKRLPRQPLVLKEVFILACGLFYMVGIFYYNAGLVELFSAATFTYVLAKLAPGKIYMPLLNFAAQMVLILHTHYKEQAIDDPDFATKMGISGVHMVMMIKLTSYGWDVYDGTRPDAQLSEQQRKSRVTRQPPFLRFLSWCFFFPAVLTGPSCGYREYEAWLDLSMFDELNKTADKGDKTAKTETAKTVKSRAIPRSGHVALAKALEGLFWTYLYVVAGSQLTSDDLFTSRYKSYPFLGRVLFLYLLGATYRLKYYSAWCISEAACIHCGLGFNGITPEGKMRWDRVRNVRAIKIEVAQNIHGLISNWNMNTSNWLRNYVYLRVTPKGQRPGAFATLVTFVTSALWHGIRPGYHLMFILMAVLQMFGRVYRHRLRPVFLNTPYKRAYDVVTWCCTQAAIGYAVQPFVVLELKKSVQVWSSVYFYVHVALAFSWLMLLGPGRRFVLGHLRGLHKELTQEAD